MKTKNKHHFRKVFKSDFLCSADLEDFIEEGKPLTFTIREVKQEWDKSVNGKKGNFNIAYFVEPIKPLVLNATNSKQVKVFAGGTPFVEDWNNIFVELHIDTNVKFGKDIVSGVRISPVQPKKENKPIFTEDMFSRAKNAAATIDSIKKRYSITPEVEANYIAYVAAK